MKISQLLLVAISTAISPIFGQDATPPIPPLQAEVFHGAAAARVALPAKLSEEYADYDAFTTSDGLGPKATRPYALLLLSNPDDDAVALCATNGTEGGFVLLVEASSRAKEAGAAVLLEDGRRALFALGGELWETDGTPSHTQRRRTISEDGDLTELVLFRGAAYFLAGDDELWRADGTSESLVEAFEGGGLGDLAAAGDAFLLLTVPGESRVLASDGVAAATVVATDAPNARLRTRTKVPFLDGRAFFHADDGLWRTGGDPESTVRFSTLTADILANHNVANDLVYLRSNRYFLFGTDGTPEGTRPINAADGSHRGTALVDFAEETGCTDGDYGTVSRFDGRFAFMSVLGGRQAFGVNSYKDGSSDGYDVWTADGDGATRAKTLYNFRPTAGTPLDDGRFLLRSKSEVWATDGSPEGTVMLLRLSDDDDVEGGALLLAFDDGSVVIDAVRADGEVSLWRLEPGPAEETAAAVGGSAPSPDSDATGQMQDASGTETAKADGDPQPPAPEPPETVDISDLLDGNENNGGNVSRQSAAVSILLMTLVVVARV